MVYCSKREAQYRAAEHMFTTLVDVQTLKAHLNDPEWIIVDCRFDLMRPLVGEQDYKSGHIPGAVYADLNRHLSAPVTASSGRHPLPEPQRFAQQLGAWGINREKQVVVYDASNGMYAVRLWWMLLWLGHQAVALLDGGLAAWSDAGGMQTASIPKTDTVEFVVEQQHQVQVQMPQLQHHLNDASYIILDARAEARYAGEIEPIDPVAGHIPGALNFPFEANLTDSGRFLDPDALKRRFANVADCPDKVVHMCGSGVTACHNLLAMEIAGLHGSRLYAGSWSEWVRDPKNLVNVGRDA